MSNDRIASIADFGRRFFHTPMGCNRNARIMTQS